MGRGDDGVARVTYTYSTHLSNATLSGECTHTHIHTLACPDTCEKCYDRGTESTPRCSVCTACVGRRASNCTPAALMSSQPCELSCDSTLHYERPESNNWCGE